MKKKIIRVSVLIIMTGIFLLFMLPFSRCHIGNNLCGTMRVEVNGQSVVPKNITCIRGVDDAEKLKIKTKKDVTRIKCSAHLYHDYSFEYDVETDDGIKHFRFMVLKMYEFGPRKEFVYQMRLNKEDGEWIAQVWLDDKDAFGMVHTIPLQEDETAYVKLRG